MRVRYMTYARVARGAVPGPAVLRPGEGLDDFLLDHFRAMLAIADNDSSPHASFIDPDARDLFVQLRTGSQDEFLNAAHALTLRLIGKMDGRMQAGLLLCMRVERESAAWAVALKLEVVTPNSAVLERLDTGEELLSAVTNVMDAPGQLQKGALVEDPREDSEVVVGDKLTKDAFYFPEAFGIRTEQRARDAAVDLIAVLDERDPNLGTAVAAALPKIPPGRREEVLDALGDEVPALTPELRRDVNAALETRPRPVRRIDTTVPIKRVIRAGNITIEGPEGVISAIDWEPRQDGGWRITIDVEDEPRRDVKRR